MKSRAPRCLLSLALLLTLLVPLAASAPAHAAYPEFTKAQKEKIAKLDPKFQQWLREIQFLITPEELEAFLELEKDYQRNAFVDRFWRSRDIYPDTARNEFRERWYELMDEVQRRFGSTDTEVAKLVLLNGEPNGILEVDNCSLLQDLQIWFYDGSQQVQFQFFLVFYQDHQNGPWRLWRALDGLDRIAEIYSAEGDARRALESGTFFREIRLRCQDGDIIATAIGWVLNQELEFESLLARMTKTPEGLNPEWVATFNSYSTDLDGEAKALPAELAIEFPGRHQNRTLVQGMLPCRWKRPARPSSGRRARTTSSSTARSCARTSCLTTSATNSTCRPARCGSKPSPWSSSARCVPATTR